MKAEDEKIEGNLLIFRSKRELWLLSIRVKKGFNSGENKYFFTYTIIYKINPAGGNSFFTMENCTIVYSFSFAAAIKGKGAPRERKKKRVREDNTSTNIITCYILIISSRFINLAMFWIMCSVTNITFIITTCINRIWKKINGTNLQSQA